MPGQPFATPVTDDEIWRNILHDIGFISESSGQIPTTMREILLGLDNGLFQTGAASFGSGIDGKQTFDGTSTITLWNGTTLVPSTSVYTLTQDLWLGDQSAINAGVTIVTAGFRIFCLGGLTNNGTIQSNGNAAAANVAGAALAYTGTLSATTVGSAGGAGGTGVGAGGTNQTNSLGGAGGAGGANASIPNAGGAGGTVTKPAATVELPFTQPLASIGKGVAGTAFQVFTAGSGGGAGGGDGTNASGAGGGGGGIVVVVAQRLQGTGTISANGGAGGNANATGNSAGGGGGGGGLVLVITRNTPPPSSANSYAASSVFHQTIAAAGGAPGTGTGTGAAGTVGAAGLVVLLAA